MGERQGNPDSLSRLTDEEKQYGDLLTCSQGEGKGSRASRQLLCEAGRESLAGDQEKLARLEQELYKDLCWGLVGFRKLELLPQLNFPAISGSTATRKEKKSF